MCTRHFAWDVAANVGPVVSRFTAPIGVKLNQGTVEVLFSPNSTVLKFPVLSNRWILARSHCALLSGIKSDLFFPKFVDGQEEVLVMTMTASLSFLHFSSVQMRLAKWQPASCPSVNQFSANVGWVMVVRWKPSSLFSTWRRRKPIIRFLSADSSTLLVMRHWSSCLSKSGDKISCFADARQTFDAGCLFASLKCHLHFSF